MIMPLRRFKLRGDLDGMGQTERTRALRRVAFLKTELAVVEAAEEFANQSSQERIQQQIDRLKVTCPNADE